MRNLAGGIRIRLTLWNSLVVLLTAFAPLFVARQGMRLAMVQETRALLQEELTELNLALAQLHPDMDRIGNELERKVLSHSRHNWFAQLVDANTGTTIWQSDNFPNELENRVNHDSGRAPVRHTRDRLVARRTVGIAPMGKGPQYIITLGEPTDFIDKDVWRLTRVMLGIGCVILFVAPIGGYFLARNAMAPVRAIVDTTRSLVPTNLNSRLPLRGTDDELDQISAEINQFVDLISGYLERQREFIGNAAHELRSPLTAIQTSVEVCLAKPRTTAEYCEQLETVAEQCQYLRHLVNQLLEIAESDAAATVDKSEFNFSQLVQKSIFVFSGVADEKGIQLSGNIQPAVLFHGDASKLMQVVNNLIDNSIKFTPSGGKVQVELMSGNEQLTLVVQDNGPGVPESSLQKIFDRFYQVDTSRQQDQARGNGLGLSICKSIVELHKGILQAETVKAGGLRITAVFDSSF